MLLKNDVFSLNVNININIINNDKYINDLEKIYCVLFKVLLFLLNIKINSHIYIKHNIRYVIPMKKFKKLIFSNK